MPGDGIDIRVFGDRELDRKLARLEVKVQKNIVRRVLRAHAKKVKQRVIGNLSGEPVHVRSGELLGAMIGAPIRAASRRPSRLIRIGVAWPSRAELGIAPEDPHFYPAAIEYGHGAAPPKPFMRPAIDNFKRLDVARIARALKKELRREGAD